MRHEEALGKVCASALTILMLLTLLSALHPAASGYTAPGTAPLSPSQLMAGPHVTGGGTELPMIAGARDIGAMPASSPVYFTLSFNINNRQSLETLIQQQSTPGNPHYRQYLSLKQFERMFGPSQTTYAEAMSYFISMGLTPVQTGSRMTIAFQGTAAQVEAAFGTAIDYYGLANGTVVYANREPLSLPAAIGENVASVNGLTNILKVRPMLIHSPLVAGGNVAYAAGGSAAAYSTMARAVNFSAPGYLFTNASFTYGATQFLNPSTMTAAYNATPLYNLGDYGQGTTIAVVMASGYNPSDLAAYSQLAFNNSSQLLDRLTPYPVSGAAGNASYPGGTTLLNSLAFEFTLDLEYSSTMAPAARLDAVYGPSLDTASLVSAYAKLTTLNPVPNIITNSWGGWEDTWWNLYGPSWQSGLALENYFMELTSMGSTIVAASGDAGGFDSYSGLLSPNFPSSSPYVTAVGGVRTTVANATGVAFPSGGYVVNETVAPYGYSETASLPTWFPDYPLNGTNASLASAETYWYSGSGSRQDTASGGIGLSYWFSQPWWQHGPAVPDTGRRMVADIAAEADFNQTVYFGGAWNFLWGGTSFAAPTVAGEFALLDAYLNSTVGNSTNRTGYYLGMAQPLLYRLGSDGHLALPPFSQITSGSNPWDTREAGAGRGWPGGQNWTSGWAEWSAGWSMLSGWGVPDAYNMAVDAGALLAANSSSNANTVLLGNESVSELPGGAPYNFTLAGKNGTPLSGATLNLTYYPGSGPAEYLNTTTATNGEFQFSAEGGAGFLEIYSTSLQGTGFQTVWFFQPNLTSGTLNISILGPASLMGGFDFFNGYLSPQYPAIEPLMPNTVAVSVTYTAPGSSTPLPVYDAMVTAQAPGAPYFSSPPSYPNQYYSGTLNATPYRSLAYTNTEGIAFVETWNVAVPVNYYVNASYLGLNATTALNVTPGYDMQSTNSFSSSIASEYGSLPGYLGLGALNTIVAPGAEGSLSYALPVKVTDWTGRALQGITVDLALMNTGSAPFNVQPVNGSAVKTNATGVAQVEITSVVTMDASATGGLLLVQAFNGSYQAGSPAVPNVTTTLPALTNDSCALLELVQPAFGEVRTLMPEGGSLVSTNYVGTVGSDASFYISTPALAAGMPLDNITSLSYSLDGIASAVPLPAAGQQEFIWQFSLPALAVGSHTITVYFSDSLGFIYTVRYTFHVIGQGVNPPPTVSFTSPSDGSYVTGRTTLNFTTAEGAFLAYETIDIGQLTYSVIGTDSFTFNASAFGYGPLFVTLTAMNLNGVVSTAFLRLYGTPQPVPSAAITSPSDYSVISGSSNLTVGLTYSGNYLTGEVLTITGPGTHYTFNTSGAVSVLIKGLGRGVYQLNYTVTSADGYSSSSVVHFTILSTGALTTSPGPGEITQLTYWLMAASAAVGAAAGAAAVAFVRRRKV